MSNGPVPTTPENTTPAPVFLSASPGVTRILQGDQVTEIVNQPTNVAPVAKEAPQPPEREDPGTDPTDRATEPPVEGDYQAVVTDEVTYKAVAPTEDDDLEDYIG